MPDPADLQQAVATFFDIYDSVPEKDATSSDAHSVGWALDGLRAAAGRAAPARPMPNARDAIRKFLDVVGGAPLPGSSRLGAAQAIGDAIEELQLWWADQ